MNKVKFVGQVQENECALCCIAMVMSFYNDKSSIMDIRRNIEVGRDGISILK